MPTNNRLLTCLTCILLVIFILGVAQLFHLQFDRGDLYPAYSSLRTDPLGTKALYESLEALSDITVKRNYTLPVTKSVDPESVLLVLGAHQSQFSMVSKKYVENIDQFVAAGGRLVIAMYPEQGSIFSQKECLFGNDEQEKNIEETSPVEEDEEVGANGFTPNDSPGQHERTDHLDEDLLTKNRLPSLPEHLGFRIDRDDSFIAGDGSASLVAEDHKLPVSIVWYSGLYFKDLDQDWRILYERNGYPVIIKKQTDAGALVLLTDSYPFSNEALVRDRYPGLLSVLLGGYDVVTFDEAHLGISKTLGVAGLLRKYQLHWFLVGALVLVGLFIWKNSVRFIPAPDDIFSINDENDLQHKDYTEGLISLLRRNISPKDILAVSVDEWNRHPEPGRRIHPVTREKIRSMMNAKGEGDPVTAYNNIIAILSEEQ